MTNGRFPKILLSFAVSLHFFGIAICFAQPNPAIAEVYAELNRISSKFGILTDSWSAGQIEMIPEQRDAHQKLKLEIREVFFEFTKNSAGPDGERLSDTEMLKRLGEVREKVRELDRQLNEEVLLPHQVPLLNMLVLQKDMEFFFRGHGNGMMDSNAAAAFFGLSKEQSAKIDEVSKLVKDEIQEEMKKHAEKIESIRKEAFGNVRGLLNDEQRKKFDELIEKTTKRSKDAKEKSAENADPRETDKAPCPSPEPV